MKTKEEDSDLYQHTLHVFRLHEPLLSDAARNRAFYAALKQHVLPGATVLDIGSGTGLWAIAAARLGASKVVAIERDSLLIPIIRRLARENQVADKIEIVESDSRQFKTSDRFDLIVSETIGNEGFDEEIVPIMIDARKRLLKRGGVLIPRSLSIVAAAAHLKSPKLPAVAPVQYNYFESLNLNIPIVLTERKRLRLLSEPVELARVDLMTVQRPPKLNRLTARWQMSDLPQINCFVIWAEAAIGEAVHIKTINTSSWNPIVYRIKPFETARGEIELKLSINGKAYHWSASLPSNPKEAERAYAPMSAYTAIEAQMQTAAPINQP